MDIAEMFSKHDNEYLKFERVVNKRSQRPDLHAFLLLDEISPGDSDIIVWAGHDEISLDFEDWDKLTEELVVELIRCGVMYDSSYEMLYSFV